MVEGLANKLRMLCSTTWQDEQLKSKSSSWCANLHLGVCFSFVYSCTKNNTPSNFQTVTRNADLLSNNDINTYSSNIWTMIRLYWWTTRPGSKLSSAYPTPPHPQSLPASLWGNAALVTGGWPPAPVAPWMKPFVASWHWGAKLAAARLHNHLFHNSNRLTSGGRGKHGG